MYHSGTDEFKGLLKGFNLDLKDFLDDFGDEPL
jgi:hypothetical protein